MRTLASCVYYARVRVRVRVRVCVVVVWGIMTKREPWAYRAAELAAENTHGVGVEA